MEFQLIKANGIDISTVKIKTVEEKFSFNLCKDSKVIKTNLTEVVQVADAPSYEGKYIVDPDFKEQTLETANKLMADNVTIKEIPHFEVDNESGGTTFYIGRMN